MPYESWVTAVACGVAVLALLAALFAVRAMRRLRAEVRAVQDAVGERGPEGAASGTAHAAGSTSATADSASATSGDRLAAALADTPVRAPAQAATSDALVYAPTPLPSADGRQRQVLPHERAVVTQEGTVIILPSEEQVVAATMGRPLVRGAVLSHGLLYALRPESRDRIRGIIRREFRRRRKVRQRAARRAARAASVSAEAPSSAGVEAPNSDRTSRGARPDATSWVGSGGNRTYEQGGER